MVNSGGLYLAEDSRQTSVREYIASQEINFLRILEKEEKLARFYCVRFNVEFSLKKELYDWQRLILWRSQINLEIVDKVIGYGIVQFIDALMDERPIYLLYSPVTHLVMFCCMSLSCR